MRRRHHSKSELSRQGIVAPCVLAGLVVTLCWIAPSPAVAGDAAEARPADWAMALRDVAPPSTLGLRQRAAPPVGILRQHVNSRLQGQFEDLATYQQLLIPGTDQVDWGMHRRFTETAVDRARRGTRRGVEDFLRANTPVGPFIERLERMNPLDRVGEIDPIRRMEKADGPDMQRRESKFDLGVGFNHLTPGLEMSRKVGKGSIRTMVDVLGWVEFEYERGGLSRTRFHVVYDARHGEAVMGCRLEF